MWKLNDAGNAHNDKTRELLYVQPKFEGDDPFPVAVEVWIKKYLHHNRKIQSFQTEAEAKQYISKYVELTNSSPRIWLLDTREDKAILADDGTITKKLQVEIVVDSGVAFFKIWEYDYKKLQCCTRGAYDSRREARKALKRLIDEKNGVILNVHQKDSA